MKVTLAENQSEITLGQFQRYLPLLKDVQRLTDLEFNSRKIEIFTGIKAKLVKNMNDNDYKALLIQIEAALEQEVDFQSRFTLNGQEFGFIPNFDNCAMGEMGDLKEYLKDFDPELFSKEKETFEEIMKQIVMSVELYENMHKAMAILFRPILNTDVFKNYSIVPYNGTSEFAETMKEMPLNLVKGALVFFSNLAKDLLAHTRTSTLEEVRKAKRRQTIGTSGVGTLR